MGKWSGPDGAACGTSAALTPNMCLKANDGHGRVQNGVMLYLTRGRLGSVTS